VANHVGANLDASPSNRVKVMSHGKLLET
jgi:hypothetical protein